MARNQHARIDREKRTVSAMVAVYCRRQHGGMSLCSECGGLLEYAVQRLEKCRFQEGKTTCARCPVHCYKPAMRERIKGVMRYAGPRMLYHHPLMALRHLLDARRKQPRNDQ